MTIDFYDPWKLLTALEAVDDAFVNGWKGSTAYEWGAADNTGKRLAPAQAGWNVCSQNLTEYGYFETVCLFDGDIFVEGLPYRTDEVRTTAGDPQATRRSISITVVARCARSRSCCE